MAKNLWGDLSSIAVIRTPKTILEEQASLLTEATSGLLIGMVADISAPGLFIHALDVVVPALNNYRYRILTARYLISIYPVTIEAERPVVNGPYRDEAEFEAGLERILSSPEVRDILAALKSQVVEPRKTPPY